MKKQPAKENRRIKFLCWVKRFFENKNNQPSMALLLVFLSFFPSTYVLLKLKTVDALLAYDGAYVLGYGVHKVTQIFTGEQKK